MADWVSVDEFATAAAVSVGGSGQLVSRRKVSMESLKSQANSVLMELAQQLAKQSRFGGAEPPKGTVLRWRKSFAKEGMHGTLQLNRDDTGTGAITFTSPQAPEYTYVAFRAADGFWYTTGQRGTNKRTWEELVREIDNAPCEIVSDWTEVPAAPEVDENVDAVEWAKSMFKAPADGKVVDAKD